MVPRAHFGPIPIGRVEISIDEPQFRGYGRMARSIFRTFARRTNSRRWLAGSCRTFLAVPLRQQGEFIGDCSHVALEVRPFTPAQIKLLETFADQAVIAIENVRLFQELKKHWNNRPRPVKFWVLSPARRRIFSRCWTPLRKMLLSFVARTMLLSGGSKVAPCVLLPILAGFRWRASWAGLISIERGGFPRRAYKRAGHFMFTTSRPQRNSFRARGREG